MIILLPNLQTAVSALSASPQTSPNGFHVLITFDKEDLQLALNYKASPC